jgi:hypothetical protein
MNSVRFNKLESHFPIMTTSMVRFHDAVYSPGGHHRSFSISSTVVNVIHEKFAIRIVLSNRIDRRRGKTQKTRHPKMESNDFPISEK